MTYRDVTQLKTVLLTHVPGSWADRAVLAELQPVIWGQAVHTHSTLLEPLDIICTYMQLFRSVQIFSLGWGVYVIRRVLEGGGG